MNVRAADTRLFQRGDDVALGEPIPLVHANAASVREQVCGEHAGEPLERGPCARRIL